MFFRRCPSIFHALQGLSRPIRSLERLIDFQQLFETLEQKQSEEIERRFGRQGQQLETMCERLEVLEEGWELGFGSLG